MCFLQIFSVNLLLFIKKKKKVKTEVNLKRFNHLFHFKYSTRFIKFLVGIQIKIL